MDENPRTSTTVLLLCARALRGFGDGFALIILPAYLSAIGYDAAQVGIVAAAALFGTALFTLGVGALAPLYDLKLLLVAGALLMVATGVAFARAEAITLFVAVAFLGTVNPSSGDIGPLIPVEHAMLSHGAADDNRTRIFARYSLVGALSMAFGALAAATPDALVAAGLPQIAAFRLMFYGYAALGLACTAL